jgi:hypothetical protein
MNDKTISPLVAIVLAVAAGALGFMLKIPSEQIAPGGGSVFPSTPDRVFPPRPSIFPKREAAGEMTINDQVALTWVRVGDRTNIYLAKKDNTDRVIEIVATPTHISVTGEGRRVGDVGSPTP